MYFDYAATTPLDERLVPLLREHLLSPLNPSSTHSAGQKARRLLEDARERFAGLLGFTSPDHVVFTSGATEAANLALRGLAQAVPQPLRIATSEIEHSCIHDTVEDLEKLSLASVITLPVTEAGRTVPNSDNGTDLLCLMHSNNETGVLQDMEAARRFCSAENALWLCDASQSIGKVHFDAKKTGADLVVLSSHKVYGPVGAGALAGPAVARLRPQITGGPQEDEHRAGTQPVALILAFVRAVELAVEELHQRHRHLQNLESAFLRGLKKSATPFEINGEEPRIPGFLNLSFPGIEAADAVIALDQAGVRVSPGSACSTGVVAVSPVLAAMFPDKPERASGGIRVTFGAPTTEKDVASLVDAVSRLAEGRV